MQGHDPRGVRLVEVLGALALGTDLGMGQPLGHAVRTCLIASGIAEELALPVATRADVFSVGLLRYIGCTADAAEIARFAGDEIALAVTVAPFVMGDVDQEQRALGVAGIEQVKATSIAAHCEAAALLATRLGLGDGVVTALRRGFERWDGAGHPWGLAEEAIPLPTRIAVVARDVELWARHGGFPVARALVCQRRGNAYDPAVADAFCAVGEPLLLRVADAGWTDLLDAEPIPVWVPAGRVDQLLEVLADFADAKLPHALGHSRSVAQLTDRAAHELRLDEAAVQRARWAALVLDLGRVGVSTRVWAKPGRLSLEEQERVRLHAAVRLARSAVLRPLATLAGAHHERLDGSGYYGNVDGTELSTLHRLLAADAYAAMREIRPHRPPLTAPAAAAQLQIETRAGRLDSRAVSAVLAAAGHPGPSPSVCWPAGLTDREVEVLRLACRGATVHAVARQLGISAKTVGRHLENSYAKIGITTRAAAALFAVEHRLLDLP